MNNGQLGRKITSLTIMTIMVAGGLTVAAPSFMPEVSAFNEGHLYVDVFLLVLNLLLMRD